MLQGAFTPPYCPALPAQMLGSISLCGGARSNCAHPQNMSRGKNIFSSLAVAWVPESCGAVGDGELCARLNVQISRGNTSTHVNVFIPPPKVCCFKKLLPLIDATTAVAERSTDEANRADRERNIVTRCPSVVCRLVPDRKSAGGTAASGEFRSVALPESIFSIRIYSIHRIDWRR